MKQLTYLLILCACLLTTALHAQLLPFIGLNSLPPDSSQICAEPWVTSSYYSSGYQVNDTVNDFKLYSLNNDSFLLSSKLQAGKPVLLISGSLTCPIFRNKVPVINQVAATYSGLIDVYVIYTIEAHPTDSSVYFGYINITSPNTSQGILFPSPANYGERKQMVDTMSSFVTLNVPVLIDGPCNECWHAFGEAPNNATLIDTNGIVLIKHGWFDRTPDNIFCALDSILGVNSGLCGGSTGNGNFTINVLNNYVSGNPGNTLYNYVDIINPNSTSVNIMVKKLQVNIPSDWETAFCADICYTSNVDSFFLLLNPMDTMHFSLDFLSGLSADSGEVRVGFRNVNNTNNSYSVWLSASTFSLPQGLSIAEKNAINAHPNPVFNILNIEGILPDDSEYMISNLQGHVLQRGGLQSNPGQIDLIGLLPGLYLLKIRSGDDFRVIPVIKKE